MTPPPLPPPPPCLLFPKIIDRGKYRLINYISFLARDTLNCPNSSCTHHSAGAGTSDLIVVQVQGAVAQGWCVRRGGGGSSYESFDLGKMHPNFFTYFCTHHDPGRLLQQRRKPPPVPPHPSRTPDVALEYESQTFTWRDPSTRSRIESHIFERHLVRVIGGGGRGGAVSFGRRTYGLASSTHRDANKSAKGSMKLFPPRLSQLYTCYTVEPHFRIDDFTELPKRWWRNEVE
jgi:hypothetical protein